ncbi:MAG TPA: enolase C-terminal domain-like protein [Lacunisphaera sp.]|nr:enolase C-terminal domain-like protein [Lacunisphaera sp.]
MPATGHCPPTAQVRDVRVGAFRVPTDTPESDGTLEWSATTLVVVEIVSGGQRGLGYTYADAAIARLIDDQLRPVLEDGDAFDIPGLWRAMFDRLRNGGRRGATAMAVSAVDVALWDLKARLLGVPLAGLFGRTGAEVPVYGSGGFTSYAEEQLRRQFAEWAGEGITHFKMKVGREPAQDRARVRQARAVVGDRAVLMVDANSAYERRQALEWGEWLAGEADVRWLEQPLRPEDRAGLAWLRARAPAQLEITDGEYGYVADDFRRMLEAEAVDVVMADATRCGGYTGLLQVAALCEAWNLPLSTHCAPALHVPIAAALRPLRHVEYFHDHARIEQELFAGVRPPVEGCLAADPSVAGAGWEFRWSDADRYQA